MLLREIYVKHFRCLLEERIPLDAVTALVGTNGSGKSNILHCLNFFYSQSFPITRECFFDRDTQSPLSVTLIFADLSDQERDYFGTYVQGDSLAITKEATWIDNGATAKYYGSGLQCPAFAPVRAIVAKPEKKAALAALVASASYAGLTTVARGDDVEAELVAWETANPGACERVRDSGQFFGYTGVGRGKIDSFSRWVFIPAVRDAAADGIEGRGNALKELLDLLLRPKLEGNAELQALRDESSRRYREILDPAQFAEMTELSLSLTERLRRFAPQTSVHLSWQDISAVSFPPPTAATQVGEGDFLAPVEYSGHGTQRAFLIAMLQHLCDTRIATRPDAPTTTPHILLGIEEPELYLHPIRARLMSRVLRELSQPASGQPFIQSVYGTHSPLFVDIQESESVRLVRRVPHEAASRPRVSKISWVSLDEVARDLAVSQGKDPAGFSGATLKPRLASVMTTSVNEGFFSDYAVLVEGDEDRPYVLAGAALKGIDLEALGISVIPVDGKSSLDRPYLIFTKLGIPCYLIYDADAGKDLDGKTNEALLRLAGEAPERFPDTKSWPTGSCFKTTFRAVVKEELGPRFDELMNIVATEVGYDRPSEARKNSLVVTETMRRCAAEGLRSATLDRILEGIAALAGVPAPPAAGVR